MKPGPVQEQRPGQWPRRFCRRRWFRRSVLVELDVRDFDQVLARMEAAGDSSGQPNLFVARFALREDSAIAVVPPNRRRSKNTMQDVKRAFFPAFSIPGVSWVELRTGPPKRCGEYSRMVRV